MSIRVSDLCFDRVKLTTILPIMKEKMKRTLTLDTASAVKMKDKLQINVSDQRRCKLDKG